MPNYRLTHKMTGTTVPATAGYYGAHNQSLTKWKQAGAEMYQWKSDDFANAYFMGATFDTDAYKTVTISGATDAAFDGTYVYSSTVSKWLKSTTHSIYKDGSTWKLTDGVTTYHAPDNGLNVPPATFYRTLELDYPDTITVVGAGVEEWNRTYSFYDTFEFEGVIRPEYRVTAGEVVYRLWWSPGDEVWWLDKYLSGSPIVYILESLSAVPEKEGWTEFAPTGEYLPAPTLEYTLEAEAATLSVSSSAKFAATSLSGTWYPVNGGTGTPVYSEYTISEAWETAESTAFNSLRLFLGGTEGKDCFRGYLPVQTTEKRYANVWMLTSGGMAGAFGIERTYGTAGAWCNAMVNADIQALFENRSTAMLFCGAVTAWIKSTNNLNQTENINWFRLRSLPEAPEETIIGDHRYWKITIPFEMLYLTEGVYS